MVRLVRNYRSTQPILDLANAAWAGAAVRYAKELVAVRSGGVRPELVDCADEATQAEEVCARVLAARERGSRLRDQAVLFRAGARQRPAGAGADPPPASRTSSTAGCATWRRRT